MGPTKQINQYNLPHIPSTELIRVRGKKKICHVKGIIERRCRLRSYIASVTAH
jgi:hypothetical protein